MVGIGVRGTATEGASTGRTGAVGSSGVTAFVTAVDGVPPTVVAGFAELPGCLRLRRRVLAFCSSAYSNGGRSSGSTSWGAIDCAPTGSTGSGTAVTVSVTGATVAAGAGTVGGVCAFPRCRSCPCRRRSWPGVAVAVLLPLPLLLSTSGAINWAPTTADGFGVYCSGNCTVGATNWAPSAFAACFVCWEGCCISLSPDCPLVTCPLSGRAGAAVVAAAGRSKR